MNPLLTYIASHLLSIIEAELASNAPEIIAITEKEVALIISKLETYIDKKAPSVAPLANPALNTLNGIANNAISTGITNLVGGKSNT